MMAPRSRAARTPPMLPTMTIRPLAECNGPSSPLTTSPPRPGRCRASTSSATRRPASTGQPGAMTPARRPASPRRHRVNNDDEPTPSKCNSGPGQRAADGAFVTRAARHHGRHRDRDRCHQRAGNQRAGRLRNQSFPEHRSGDQPSAVECDDPQQQQESRDDENYDPRPEPRSASSALRSRLANSIPAYGHDSSSPNQREPRQHDDHEPPPRPPRELHRSSMPDATQF